MSSRSWLLGAVLSAVVLGLSSGARADEFDKIRLQSQKLTGEVTEALARAKTLETTDPSQGRDILRDVLLKLEDAVYMPERQRRGLEQSVRDRIQALTQRIRAKRPDEEKKTDKPGGRDDVRDRYETSKPPMQSPSGGGPKSIAEDRIKTAKASEEFTKRIKDAQAAGLIAVDRDMNSATLAKEEWVTERYIKSAQRRLDKMTKEEKEVLKTLNSVMTPDFDKASLKEVLGVIMEKTGVAILVDEGSLKELNIEYDSEKVDFKLKAKVPVRTILRKVLRERGLDYIIKEGMLHVMTIERTRQQLVTRAYPVADLVAPDPRLGPVFGQMQFQANVEGLIRMIQGQTDPTLWSNGQPNGPSITFHGPTMSLIVRAPAEMHLMMGYGGGR